MIKAIINHIWSAYPGNLYHADPLDLNQEIDEDYKIVLVRFPEIYHSYLPKLLKVIKRTTLEYLRIKCFRGDPYIAMIISKGVVAHVSFVAKTISYSEYPILNKNSRAVGPCLTINEFRGKGLYPLMLKYLRGSPLGRDGLDIFCRTDNISSIRGIEKAGFVLLSQYTEYTRFGLAFIKVDKKHS